MRIDPAKVFELPEDAAQNYTIANPFKDPSVAVTRLRAGKDTTFQLQPFEVLVVEALPDDSLTGLAR